MLCRKTCIRNLCYPVHDGVNGNCYDLVEGVISVRKGSFQFFFSQYIFLDTVNHSVCHALYKMMDIPVRCKRNKRSTKLNTPAALNQFLADHERRAFRIAQLAVGDSDAALDIVQDAMLDFVRRYRDKPEAEWPPLFYKVVQSRITDAHRRQTVRNRVWSWFSRDPRDSEELDLIQETHDPNGVSPLQQLERKSLDTALKEAIRSLPLRQQQAFLLRSWAGLDVAETALAMGCSAGSVKTHYYRAVQVLRRQLEVFKP